MNESDWLDAQTVEPLLTFVTPRLSERKLRLFAVACARRILHLPLSASVPGGIDRAEQVAEGAAEDGAIVEAGRQTYLATESDAAVAARETAYNAARLLSFHTTYPEPKTSDALGAWSGWSRLDPDEVRVQCALLRDIAGNPFLSFAVEPLWLVACEGVVVRLARSIYEDRAFDRMPILGDALEDAGCTDEYALAHAHGPGPHVRGCWLLDALLARS